MWCVGTLWPQFVLVPFAMQPWILENCSYIDINWYCKHKKQDELSHLENCFYNHMTKTCSGWTIKSCMLFSYGYNKCWALGWTVTSNELFLYLNEMCCHVVAKICTDTIGNATADTHACIMVYPNCFKVSNMLWSKFLWTCRIVCQTGVQLLHKLLTDFFFKLFGLDSILNRTAGCTSVIPSKHSLLCNIMEGGLIILAT